MKDKELEISEEKLQACEERYRSIVNSFVDVYYQTDSRGIITEISPSCFVVFGRKPEELVGSNITNLYASPELRKVFLEQLFKNGTVRDYEVDLLHQDGRRLPISVSSRIIKYEKGDFRVEGIIRDISERKQIEEELSRSREELKSKIEELEKMNSFMMNRELKIIELKNEIAELKKAIIGFSKAMIELNDKIK